MHWHVLAYVRNTDKFRVFDSLLLRNRSVAADFARILAPIVCPLAAPALVGRGARVRVTVAAHLLRWRYVFLLRMFFLRAGHAPTGVSCVLLWPDRTSNARAGAHACAFITHLEFQPRDANIAATSISDGTVRDEMLAVIARWRWAK